MNKEEPGMTKEQAMQLIPMQKEYNASMKQLQEEVEMLRLHKDDAYWERNQLVCYLSTLFPSWIEHHPKEDQTWDVKWKNIVFIQFPEGLFCWHIHDSEIGFFDHLKFKVGNSWDGHSNTQKYWTLRYENKRTDQQ